MNAVIDYFSLGHPLSRLRSHYAWRARERMLQRFIQVFQPTASSKILDVGVTPDTSLIESNHFEQRYPWPGQLTAVSIEDVSGLAKRFPEVSFQTIAPGRLPFADQSFDFVFCSAVVEHVGTREQQRAFVAELSRVSRGFLLSTPNRWFPLEFHTILPLLHWLPQRAHQAVLRFIGKDFWAQTSSLNLLGPSDLRGMLPAWPNARVETVRLFGWPSNLIGWGLRS